MISSLPSFAPSHHSTRPPLFPQAHRVQSHSRHIPPASRNNHTSSLPPAEWLGSIIFLSVPIHSAITMSSPRRGAALSGPRVSFLFICFPGKKKQTFRFTDEGHRDSTKPGDLIVLFFFYVFPPPKVLHGPILATSSDTEKKKKNPFNCPRCQSPPLAFTAWQLCRWLR